MRRPPMSVTSSDPLASQFRGHVSRAACDHNGPKSAFQAVHPSCGAAACVAHDAEPGGSDREHDAMATVLIIGASRGIGLEAVKAALAAGHSVRALARSEERRVGEGR